MNWKETYFEPESTRQREIEAEELFFAQVERSEAIREEKLIIEQEQLKKGNHGKSRN